MDNEHRSSVVKVAWTKTNCASKHVADRMTLASSDTSGKILVSSDIIEVDVDYMEFAHRLSINDVWIVLLFAYI